MVDFFLRDSDDQKAAGASHLDNIDLVPSKIYSAGTWGPALVAVAVRDGAHVCWQCSGYFELEKAPLRPMEVKMGTVPVLLHRKCVGVNRLSSSSVRTFDDVMRGLNARKFAEKATKALAEAAKSDSSILVVPK